jgi:hypothetical protein
MSESEGTSFESVRAIRFPRTSPVAFAQNLLR